MSHNRNSSIPNALLNALTIVLVAIAVLWLDQYTKHLVLEHVRFGSYVQMVIPRVLRWNFAENYHGAFGLFGSNAVHLIGMAIVVLVLFWFSFRDAAARSGLVRVAFGMIVGGAIGNVVDRLHYGYVIDFVDVYKVWPNIFNVADSCITIGVVLLLLSSLATRRHR